MVVTMIEPATRWFKMKDVKNKELFTVATAVEQTWLNCHRWPEIIFDRGSEYMGELATMVSNDYGLNRHGTTVQNPPANAILKRMHQTIGNIIIAFDIYNNEDLDLEHPWSEILVATTFYLGATYHTTLKATPSQLVFGRDADQNAKFAAYWNLIKNNKQKLINTNNSIEINKRITYTHQINEEVICEGKPIYSKFGPAVWEGPFEIVKINVNGSVCIRKAFLLKQSISEELNLIIILHSPYHEGKCNIPCVKAPVLDI
jgi:hypothetical protein